MDALGGIKDQKTQAREGYGDQDGKRPTHVHKLLLRTAVGRPDHKYIVEDCADRHIPQRNDLCGYKR